MMDREGPFGWLKCVSTEKFHDILQKKGQFEGMSWDAMQKNGSHNIEAYRLEKPARDRLEEIGLDDIDHLYSLRLTGTNRIWCIQDLNLLRVIWWDPDHQVYIVPKKNT